MLILDMTGVGDPYSQKKPEVEHSVPLVTDLYGGMVSIYNALNNNADQISVGLTLALLNFYF